MNCIFSKNLAIILCYLFLLSSCSSTPLLKPNYSSREDYIESNVSLKHDVKQAILEGMVIVGMTKEQVKASWGESTRIDNYINSPKYYAENEEGWYYKGILGSLLEPSKWVFFKNERVEEVDVTVK